MIKPPFITKSKTERVCYGAGAGAASGICVATVLAESTTWAAVLAPLTTIWIKTELNMYRYFSYLYEKAIAVDCDC